ncbi:hypothetical protein TBR22_A11920 [Luteitalea sp. TBR-22]|uniref:gas vesicle protein GvpJ n=1 Tax=Luteitalea sp. TBR-22 TaxID=2802971 RepID=UPI001AF11497|nr:gas vesicle protein GvpJ [Luteitalea sp. TBR-22]BCS31988.1 hypothetical protein TBR22_A11920 [Luteitalea sp. TBR-22]
MDERQPTQSLAASLTGGQASLVDVIDSLVDKGVVLQGDVALGIAGIDLITLKLAALLVSAERLAASSPPGDSPSGGHSSPASDAREQAQAEVVATDVTAEAPAPPWRIEDIDAAPSPRPAADSLPAAGIAAREPAPVHVPSGRWDVDPDNVRRSVMKLVLTLVEVIRQLLERRAIRQMEAERLTDAEVERLGRSLHELEQTIVDLAAQAGLDPADLNLDLGPLGRLL